VEVTLNGNKTISDFRVFFIYFFIPIRERYCQTTYVWKGIWMTSGFGLKEKNILTSLLWNQSSARVRYEASHLKIVDEIKNGLVRPMHFSGRGDGWVRSNVEWLLSGEIWRYSEGNLLRGHFVLPRNLREATQYWTRPSAMRSGISNHLSYGTACKQYFLRSRDLVFVCTLYTTEGFTSSPDLYLHNSALPIAPDVRSLWLQFHSRLTWDATCDSSALSAVT
jgi:hypothetical protein